MTEMARAAACLADLAHALASGESADARVRHALVALRQIVPYDRAILLNTTEVASRQTVEPPLGEVERQRLAGKAERILALVCGRPGDEFTPLPRQPGQLASHLAVPLVSQDEVAGLLLVEREGGHYESQDLQLLSVVASQLGAYFTTLRLREGELRAQSALKEQLARKSRFLAILSHELRNPLAPIGHALHLLDRVEPRTEAALRARAVITRQYEHLCRLVDDLLDTTRVTSGKAIVQRSRIDLAEVAARCVEDHRAIYGRASVELSFSRPSGPVPVEGDPVRLAQAIANLLANAVQYGHPGGRTEVRVDLEGATALVSVKDDGAGIAPEVLPRLFEALGQEDDPSRGGLGLAVAKGLVELHGGVLGATSQGADQGAVFTIRLPALPLGAEGEQRPTSTAERRVPHRRVLIVEDDLDTATTLRDLLEMLGHEVELARDGREALARARGFAPELVLCDLGLPGMSGYEVARELKAAEGGVGRRLIALTGDGRGEDRALVTAAGFDGHLVKPVSIAALEDILLAEPRTTQGPAVDSPPGP
ncbi:MAG TPA: ATP-binding protein [Anaeromyxobacteraceae bacterium]|nr:ATP-binding protein [Anaeromyxobacteraceae bacterium]